MASQTAPSLDERGVIVACGQCGQANRIPFEKLGGNGQCPRCKTPLPPVNQPIEVATPAQFRALTTRSSLPVLVDFWAPWCGPCRMVAPEVEKAAATTSGQLIVAKVNTEELPQVASPMGIRSIPTFAVLAGGREADRTAGALPAPQLREFALRASGKVGR